ncbi:MAG TPA: hypothetical protein VN783_01435 [Thermoanaerobaculia bacterium]|nr:hypothetical protein [Thermoanaerobaculia bacterium]
MIRTMANVLALGLVVLLAQGVRAQTVPPISVSEVSVSCSDVSGRHATRVMFRVDQTGEWGSVELVQGSVAGEPRGELFDLNKQRLLTLTLNSPPRFDAGRPIFDDIPSQCAQFTDRYQQLVNDGRMEELEAFHIVFQQPGVIDQVLDCVAKPIPPTAQPITSCDVAGFFLSLDVLDAASLTGSTATLARRDTEAAEKIIGLINDRVDYCNANCGACVCSKPCTGPF